MKSYVIQSCHDPHASPLRKTTHLICPATITTANAKYLFANLWNIPPVTKEWVQRSLDRWAPQVLTSTLPLEFNLCQETGLICATWPLIDPSSTLQVARAFAPEDVSPHSHSVAAWLSSGMDENGPRSNHGKKGTMHPHGQVTDEAALRCIPSIASNSNSNLAPPIQTSITRALPLYSRISTLMCLEELMLDFNLFKMQHGAVLNQAPTPKSFKSAMSPEQSPPWSPIMKDGGIQETSGGCFSLGGGTCSPDDSQLGAGEVAAFETDSGGGGFSLAAGLAAPSWNLGPLP